MSVFDIILLKNIYPKTKYYSIPFQIVSYHLQPLPESMSSFCHSRKFCLKIMEMSSAKCRPLCLGLNVLRKYYAGTGPNANKLYQTKYWGRIWSIRWEQIWEALCEPVSLRARMLTMLTILRVFSLIDTLMLEQTAHHSANNIFRWISFNEENKSW